MSTSSPARWPAALSVLAAALLLAGCTTLGIDDALKEVNASAAPFTGGALELDRSPPQREARATLSRNLLDHPLSQNDAVRLALTNSPAVQALVARSWADIATATQAGRMPNPVLSLERLRLGGELELGRLLSFGLMDVLLLPQRLSMANSEAARATVALTSAVVDQVTQVRQAWVHAVAARQLLQYAEQVNGSAEASTELAHRMQQAGNFSRLQRARQQVFHADATTRLASARHTATAAQEALVRALGLDDAQAARLQLPERLPDLPASPRDARDLAATAGDQRLDLRLARAQLDVASRSRRGQWLPSFLDVEMGVRRDTVFDGNARQTRRGFELDIRLPLLDWGSARREGLDARSLAAAHHYDATVRGATSQLREAYSAYRTAYDIARHHRDEIVPLRRLMAEENLLRYNGMFIGVFELLADARDQVAGVTDAIRAQQQFWLADAALEAAVIGRPMALAAPTAAVGSPSTADTH